MNDVTLRAVITAEASGFSAGIAGIRTGIGQVLGDLGRLGKAVFNVFDPQNAAVQFEKQLTNIRSLGGYTKDEIDKLGKSLLSLDSTFPQQERVNAFYDIASGVGNVAQRMPLLNSAIATAEAGGAGLQGTTAGLMATMNAYSDATGKTALVLPFLAKGMNENALATAQANVISDVFTRTVGVGVGTMDQFVAAMAPVSPTMKLADVSFQSFGSMMAYMTTKGLSASEAANSIRMATISLLKPNKEMEGLFEKIGVTSGSMLIKQVGLAAALQKVSEAAGNTDTLTAALGRVEALSAASVIGQDAYTDFAINFESGMKGATDAAREVQMTSDWSSIEKGQAASEKLSIEMGSALLPTAKDVNNEFLKLGVAGVIGKGGLNLLVNGIGEVAGSMVSTAITLKLMALMGATGGAGLAAGGAGTAFMSLAGKLSIWGLAATAALAAGKALWGWLETRTYDQTKEGMTLGGFNAAQGNIQANDIANSRQTPESYAYQARSIPMAGGKVEVAPTEEFNLLLRKGYGPADALVQMNTTGLMPNDILYNLVALHGLGPNNTLDEISKLGYIPADVLEALHKAGYKPSDTLLKVIAKGMVVYIEGLPGGGRTQVTTRDVGGSVNKGIYQFGVPEVLSMGGKNYLMSPGAGMITPLTPSGRGGGGGGNTYQVSVVVQSHDTVQAIDQELARVGLPPLSEMARRMND